MAAALQSLSLAGAELTVLWDDNSSSELGFRIERSTDGNTFSPITTLPSNTTTYTDSSLVPGATYWYRVRAFDFLHISAPSNVTSGTTSSGSGSASVADPSTSLDSGRGSVADPSASFDSDSISVADPSTSNTGRIKVFTARAVAGTASAQPISIDFTVSGGSASLLLRGIGPALSSFTSAKTLLDPTLTLDSGMASVGTNDNWGGASSLISLFNQVGAFSLSSSSNDAALYITATERDYTQTVSGNDIGLAQAEIYDAETATASAGRLSRILTRATVGTASGTLISGFVIAGNSSVQLLVRAIGPSLPGGSLSDPILTVYNGSTQVEQNDNWGGSSSLGSAFSQVGASALPATSADSAMIVTLPPGTYTATVAGVNGTVGTARLEFYVMP
ncbi:MAG: fibronectin type III domain-containing protein [Opitutus sp.]